MARGVTWAAALAVALLALPARGDEPSGGCGGSGPRAPLPPNNDNRALACTAAARTSSTQTCEECAVSDAACIALHTQGGFASSCTDHRAAGDVAVLCKPTGTAGRRQLSVPMAALLLGASIFATIRLRRDADRREEEGG